MKINRLKEIIKDMPDDLEIFIRNTNNICGSIAELEQVEKSYYGFFGMDIPCIILNTSHTNKELEYDEDKEEYIDYIETDNKRK